MQPNRHRRIMDVVPGYRVNRFVDGRVRGSQGVFHHNVHTIADIRLVEYKRSTRSVGLFPIGLHLAGNCRQLHCVNVAATYQEQGVALDGQLDILGETVVNGMASNICGNGIHGMVNGGDRVFQRVRHRVVHAITDSGFQHVVA